MAETHIKFGSVLRQARERVGLSRIALAQRTSFDPSYIHRLETGTRQPSRAAVLALAEAVEIHSQELSTWLTAAGFAPLPFVAPSRVASRTRSTIQRAHSVAGEPAFQLADRWAEWLEAMGLRQENIERLLRRMEVAKMAERRQVTESVSSLFSYLADMLAAPVRTAVIPAASGNLMVARHVIQRLLLRAIGEAADAGISKVVLVIAPGTEQFFYTPLKEAFEFSIAPKLGLEYSVQQQPEGLGDAVLHAEEFIGKEPFAVLLPDELLHSRAERPDRSGELRSMMSAFNKLPGGNLIAVKSIPKSKMQRSGIARLGEECASRIFRVDELVEKPSSGSLISRSASAFGIVGRYLLRADIFPALRELKLRGDRPLQLTAALDLIRHRDESVYAYDLKVGRQDIGEVLGKTSDLFGVSAPEKNVSGKKESVERVRGLSPSGISPKTKAKPFQLIRSDMA